MKLIRKVLPLLLAAGVYFSAGAAKAQTTVAISGATSNVSSIPFSVGAATRVIVHVQSESTSAATVTITQRVPSISQFPGLGYMTVATITNPTINGEVWGGPGGGFLQINVTGYGSGTIWVTVEAWNGKDRVL